MILSFCVQPCTPRASPTHITNLKIPTHAQVKTITDEMGVYFLGLGFDPISTHAEVPVMPKQRYGLMRNYMPTRGELGLDMMFRSCTIQVCASFWWGGSCGWM